MRQQFTKLAVDNPIVVGQSNCFLKYLVMSSLEQLLILVDSCVLDSPMPAASQNIHAQ
jgi:hypothetical protein